MTFHVLQPMLQELGKQNPYLMRLIQEHQADFLRLINEPVEGEGWDESVFRMIYTQNSLHVILNCLYLIRNVLGQLASAMPQAVTVTPEEREAIERVSSSLDTIYFFIIGAEFHSSLNICSQVTVLKFSVA